MNWQWAAFLITAGIAIPLGTSLWGGIIASVSATFLMTSNGERAGLHLEELHTAGLKHVIFSIFGATPEEIAQVQGPFYSTKSFAHRQILKLNSAVQKAIDLKLHVSANIVMSNSEHESRVRHLIETYSDTDLQIRILSDLGIGFASSISIYNLLAKLKAIPIHRKMYAGASSILVYYQLPRGQQIVFKQIRETRLPSICNNCQFNNLDDCREGYYGIRVYVDSQGAYKVGVCIQRMDLTVSLQRFLEGELPQTIKNLRDYEYSVMSDTALVCKLL
jgi:cyclic pyranopterin phosphate synthase